MRIMCEKYLSSSPLLKLYDRKVYFYEIIQVIIMGVFLYLFAFDLVGVVFVKYRKKKTLVSRVTNQCRRKAPHTGRPSIPPELCDCVMVINIILALRFESLIYNHVWARLPSFKFFMKSILASCGPGLWKR